jgi:nucleoside-diphosphate-sugar epimerase
MTLTETSFAITGATGMIGRFVIDALVESGVRRIRALVLPSEAVPSAWAQLPVVVHRGDILHAADLSDFIDGADVVLHLAASVGDVANRGTLEEARTVNVGGTANLHREAARRGVRRFVLMSTCCVYGLTSERPGTIDESSPYRPDARPYDLSKTEAERLVFSASNSTSMTVSALEVPAVLGGAHTPRGRAPGRGLMKLVRLGIFPSCSGGDTWANYVFGADVAAALLHIATHPRAAGRSFIFSEAVPLDLMFRWIAEDLGVGVRRIPVPRALVRAAGWLRPALSDLSNRRRFVAERLCRELGFSPRIGLRRGLSLTIAHYRACGVLPV